MMHAGLVLWLGLLCASPEWPLGPYARPGVPLPVHSAGPAQVDLHGWRSRVEGLGWVHPLRLPAEAPGPLAVPEGRRLVGVWGDLPADLLAELATDAIVVRIDLTRLDAGAWRALDLFDRLYATRRTVEGDALLTAWVRAGGLAGVVGEIGPVAGLGRLFTAPDADQLINAGRAVADRPAARLPAARPWIYDLVGPPRGGGRALRTARWIVAVFGLGVLAHLLLAHLGRMGRSLLFAGIGVLTVAATGIALLRAEADYRPAARGRIEIEIAAPGSPGVRRRIYEVFSGVAPRAEVFREPLWTPVPYRSLAEPWWRTSDGREFLSEGVTHIYLREEWVEPAEAAPTEAAPPGLALREFGEGWSVSGSMSDPFPVADAGPVPLLGRFRAVPLR